MFGGVREARCEEQDEEEKMEGRGSVGRVMGEEKEEGMEVWIQRNGGKEEEKRKRKYG